ncbi:hypothetical protein XI05_08935 [Bradyrhizobium sp. CCBAU 11357]|nr:hypothetical protein [Bradyrhizobium sp. CCBAU 11357]
MWQLAAKRLKSDAHERDNMNILRVAAIGLTASSRRWYTTELDKHEDRKLSSIRYITLLGATGYSTPTAERSRIEMGSDDALDIVRLPPVLHSACGEPGPYRVWERGNSCRPDG